MKPLKKKMVLVFIEEIPGVHVRYLKYGHSKHQTFQQLIC